MKCKNCGATLKYDPKTKLIVCDSCGSKFKPKERTTQKSDYAEEHKEEVKQEETGSYYLYICPSCGAELVGTYDTSAVGFCSYCGGQSIVRSKIEGVKRPRYIVPFSKTKKECCDEYLDVVNRLPFVPKELKDEAYINEIRGIYIPYYIYHADTEGHIKMQAHMYSGSYEHIYHTDADFKGGMDLPVDASIQMDDDIGLRLFPNDEKDVEEFNENYMTGYYAEMPDTKPEAYYKDTADQAEALIPSIFNTKTDDRLTYSTLGKIQAKTSVLKPFVTMIPTYFLTYRKDDRVCYAIFGGRKSAKNREMYSTVPIASGKYLLAVFVMTLVLTGILSLLPTLFTHKVVMNVMAALSNACLWIIAFSMKKEGSQIDKTGQVGLNKNPPAKKGSIINIIGIILLVLCFGGASPIVFMLSLSTAIGPAIAWLASFVPLGIGMSVSSKHNGQIRTRYLIIMFLANTIVSVFATIAMIKFFADEYLYAGMIFASVSAIAGMLGVYKQYNQACTRALPHFTRQGGYNSAKDL